ncbi:uncharacterized protein ZBAI_03560 [Zygosaccharomyces bailii ISA1307]|nr:uncharacterized protein ZBAI_03560 [Zygosaccharomyces bailii ISA1307]
MSSGMISVITAKAGRATLTFLTQVDMSAKTVMGVKRWVDEYPVPSTMTVRPMSRCLDANAQFEAISRCPELFVKFKCMVCPQPVTVNYPAEAFCAGLGRYS